MYDSVSQPMGHDPQLESQFFTCITTFSMNNNGSHSLTFKISFY